MSKVDELIHELCPDGVERVALGEVLQNFDRFRKPISRGKRVPGEYPYYGANGVQDYVEDFIFEGDYLLIGEDGSVLTPEGTGVVNWASGKIWVNNHAHVLQTRTDENSLRFFYYLLQTLNIEEFVTGGIQPKLNQKNLNAIPIPLPPLEVQEEIVRILDQFSESVQELDRELEAEIEAREKQFLEIRDRVLSLEGVDRVKLGEIGSVAMCKRVFKNQTSDKGDIPFFKIGTFGKVPDSFISRHLYNEYREKYSYPEPGDILISASGSIGRTVEFDGEPSYFQDSNIVWLKHDGSRLHNSFLKHWYEVVEWYTEGGIIQRLYNKNILNSEIALPSVEAQLQIAEQLDETREIFTEYIDNLKRERELRRKQYEYYRDRLLDFKVKE